MEPDSDYFLIPGLADDAALLCLTRLSFRDHASARCVCKRWRDLFSQKRFFEFRKEKSFASECIFLLLDNGAIRKFYLLNPDSREWSEINLVTGIKKYLDDGITNSLSRAVVVPDYGIYIIRNDTDVLKFDPYVLKWDILNQSFNLHNHVFAIAGTSDSVFVLAGYDLEKENDALDEFHFCSACLFDVNTLSWIDKSIMPFGNDLYNQTFVFDDKVFFTYRFYRVDGQNDIPFYDLKTESWGKYPSLANSPFEFMVVINNHLYGLHSFNNSLEISRFDRSSETFEDVLVPLINDVNIISVIGSDSRMFIIVEILFSLAKILIFNFIKLDEVELECELNLPENNFLDAQIFSFFI